MTARNRLRDALLAVAVFLAVLALLTLTGCEWGTEEDAEPSTVTVPVMPVDGSPAVTLDADQEQTQAERPEGVDAHEDARDETPPGVSAEDAEQVLEPVAGIGEPLPVGGAESLSCPKQLVRNESSRNGAKVAMIVLHYTVSAPGTLDVIQSLFDRPSFAASSHLGLEGTGRCEQWVDYGRKAWTQGAFNPVSESVEIIARGSEPRAWWLSQPIIAKGLLAGWIVDRLRANGLPPRFVNPSGCTPLAGWTDHESLDCGNSHTDVQPHFPYDVVKRQVVERFNVATTVLVWQVRSGGEVLRQVRATVVDGVSGYDRAVGWMRGPGEAKVRAAEKANGDVRLVLREVAL